MINAVSNTWKPQIVATTIAKISMRRISGKVRYQNGERAGAVQRCGLVELLGQADQDGDKEDAQ